MKTKTAQKIPEMFVPEDIVASSLLLVGYKLFPATQITLHPRMTVLSGNNAVGKTTILDAVQTILICHQQFINLNVATGQFDRGLAGQMSGRVGWAVLAVSGHEELTALGVRLHAKATTESLELTPFVLSHIPPELELFVDRQKQEIIPDFQTLKRNILQQDLEGQAHDFASADEYHRYLFAQGLLPVAMDRQGKRKFATLWRQVTRPKLDKLGSFLKEMLCPEPAQGVKFADVERLMRDRRKLSEQLQALERFRATRQELEERRTRLDERRYLYLCTELGRQWARFNSCEQRMQQEKEKEERTAKEMRQLEENLQGIQTRQKEVSSERDKYLRQQSELSRQKRHYQQYTQAREQEAELKQALESTSSKLAKLQAKQKELQQERDQAQSRAAELRAKIAEQKERLKHLQVEKQRYLELQGLLKESKDKLGKELKTWPEVQQAWIQTQKEKSRLDSLPEQKRRLQELDNRVSSHQESLELARSLQQELPGDMDIKELQAQGFEELVEGWEELDYESEISRVSQELQSLEGQIADLEQGRPSLPQAIARHVEAGRISLVASRFEHLDLEEAKQVQSRLGPFARGILVDEPGELADLDLGDQEFLLLGRDTDPQHLSCLPAAQGHISGQGNFYWYTPKSHVWLGARARARELERLGQRRLELQKELNRLQNERSRNRERIRQARKLLGKWSALQDTACLSEQARLREEISWLEKQSQAILERFRYLQDLQGRKEHFELHAAPGKCKECEKELKGLEKELKGLEESLGRLQKDIKSANQELEGLQAEYSRLDRELAAVSSRLQGLLQEEPRDVLEGRIDFSEAQAIQDRIDALDQELSGLAQSRDNLYQEKVRKGDFFQHIREELQRLEKDAEQARQAEQGLLQQWKQFYSHQEPEYRAGHYSSEDTSRLHLEWEMAAEELKKSVSRIASEYVLHLPQESPVETQVDMILENIIPSFLELERVEDQFQRLQQELAEIEARIKTYVQDIRQKVDQEISKLRRRLDKVNSILADIRFGRISQVRIELSYLSQYENLKKLKGDVLSLMDFGSQTTLQEFVQTLVKNIFRQGRGDINEEKIADYRTYIELGWSITDQDGESRQKGFSGGETLGINLAICLGLLFHWGGETGQAQTRGLLIMALDEAERLDEQAVYTVRELLERTGSQLLVALPRTIDVPETICHLLTPLEQGVTHVSVYHKDQS
ncbi:MAG: SbcC/MukB-like Walker B domain-containing protein [Thermodesulfobacteriota bacterium]